MKASRLALQIIHGSIAFLTLMLGSMQLFTGTGSPIYSELNLIPEPVLDSNLRFFGGMAIGLGLAGIWILPHIEKQTLVFRIFWLCALIGGIGRLISLVLLGPPSILIVSFTILEVLISPALIYWQYRISLGFVEIKK